MVHRNFSALLAFFLISLVLGVSGGGEAIVGGWRPIKDPTEAWVVAIGKFAVTEHNKEAKSELEFKGVVKGETQVVSGWNYRLTIAASDGGTVKKYEALVWEKPWQKLRTLTSFKPVLELPNGN